MFLSETHNFPNSNLSKLLFLLLHLNVPFFWWMVFYQFWWIWKCWYIIYVKDAHSTTTTEICSFETDWFRIRLLFSSQGVSRTSLNLPFQFWQWCVSHPSPLPSSANPFSQHLLVEWELWEAKQIVYNRLRWVHLCGLWYRSPDFCTHTSFGGAPNEASGHKTL